MEHIDEELIKIRKAKAAELMDEMKKEEMEREKQESILSGMIHILGKEVKFGERTFEDLGISMWMPETFEELEEEMKKVLYPFGNPPTHIFADFDIPFQITCQKTGHVVPEESMPRLIDMASKVLENYGPNARMLAKGTVKIREHLYGIMESVTKSLDGKVHNVMCYMSINSQVLLVTINFSSIYSERMSVIAKEIIDNIVIIEEKTEE